MKKIFYASVFIFFLFALGFSETAKEQQKDGFKYTLQGVEEYSNGCYNRALKYFYDAYQIFSLTDDIKSASVCLNNIGNIYREMKNREKAILFFDSAISNYKKMDAKEALAEVFVNKAIMEIEAKNYDEALKFLKTAKKINPKNSYLIDSYKAIVFIKKADFITAEKILNRVYKNKKSKNSAIINCNMGNLFFEKKEYVKAISFYKKALKIDKKNNYHSGIAQDLYNIAKSKIALKDITSATDYLIRSAKIFAILNNKTKVEDINKKMKELGNATFDKSIDYFFIDLWTKENSVLNFCN